MKLSATDHIWIFGAGRFGAIAARRLAGKVAPANIRIVDHRPERLRNLPPGVEGICNDSVQYLVDNLGTGEDPAWIVPAVPLHVAWEFIRRRLAAGSTIDALPPDSRLVSGLPNAMTGQGGAIYASIADFRCPDDCTEPESRCTHTGKPRPMTLFEAIPKVAGPKLQTVVVRSRQLAPGVGGYQPEALLDALEKMRTSKLPVLLATACRCHGVMHGVNAGL